MRTKKLFASGAVILVAAAVASLVTALPAQDSFCRICSAHKEVRPYGLRFTALVLARPHTIQRTPLSALLDEKHLVAAHEHEWLAPAFVPDPRDEFGPKVLVSLSFINAPRVVNFMRNVADYADPVTVANWKATVMEPSYTRVIDAALRFARVPETGFENRAEFITWWGLNGYTASQRVHQLTEPD